MSQLQNGGSCFFLSLFVKVTVAVRTSPLSKFELFFLWILKKPKIRLYHLVGIVGVAYPNFLYLGAINILAIMGDLRRTHDQNGARQTKMENLKTHCLHT